MFCMSRVTYITGRVAQWIRRKPTELWDVSLTGANGRLRRLESLRFTVRSCARSIFILLLYVGFYGFLRTRSDDEVRLIHAFDRGRDRRFVVVGFERERRRVLDVSEAKATMITYTRAR